MSKPRFVLPSPTDIKKLRLARNLTQSQLATLSGLSQSLIARIENATVNPRVSTLQAILSVLYRNTDALESINAFEIATKKLVLIKSDETVSSAIESMDKYGVSQLPVISESKEIIGSISEKKLVIHLAQKGKQGMEEKIINLLEPSFQRIPVNTTINDIEKYLLTNSALLVEEDKAIKGILTKSDLLQYFKKQR